VNRRPGHTRTETSTINDGLRLFCLQANIKFKIVDIAVEALGHLCDLWLGVPSQEAGIRWKETKSTGCFKI
jgi:hypothetical protein